MTDVQNWDEMIDRHLHGELTDDEKERLAEWLDRDAASRETFVNQVQWDTDLTEALRQNTTIDEAVVMREPARSEIPSRMKTLVALLTVCTVALVVIAAGSFLDGPDRQPLIARVTGQAGPLQWTGSGGQVSRNVTDGTELPGGTIEGLAPESWCELEFRDGSTVTITGDSLLTFADLGQKELHLREGSFSGNIQPQPSDRPMLIYTRSARLEVLGTQFGLEAEPWSTALNVSEGLVRMTRLSDGESTEVPARHRAVAAIDRELKAEQVPESVGRWQSQIHRSPDQTFGRWTPPTDSSPAFLKDVPFQIPDGRNIYVVGLGVTQVDHPPVVLQEGSQIRVQGQMAESSLLFVGVTLRDADGEFAGKFQTIRPAEDFTGGEDFDVTVALSDFELDPSLHEIRHKLPGHPFGLTVESIWCHTLFTRAGLRVADIKLFSET